VIRVSKNLIKYTGLYVLLMFVSVLLGWILGLLAYAVFFISSAFFSGAIVYETWKTSRPLKEVTYPTRNKASGQNEITHLTGEIEKAISKKSPSTYVMSRLRQILVRRIALRSSVVPAMAEPQNPKELEKLSYDDLARLLNGENVLPRAQNQRINLLNEILGQLEES
jgi:hypothetical protein